jgi:hypothetical protein
VSAASGRQHASWARLLIKACGGLDESARASRLSVSHLSRCQDGSDPSVLPVDVIADLELYCGQAIYSRALVSLLEGASSLTVPADLVSEGCDVGEAGAELQAAVRKAARDGKLSERERRDLCEKANKVRQELSDMERLLAAGDGNG